MKENLFKFKKKIFECNNVKKSYKILHTSVVHCNQGKTDSSAECRVTTIHWLGLGLCVGGVLALGTEWLHSVR